MVLTSGHCCMQSTLEAYRHIIIVTKDNTFILVINWVAPKERVGRCTGGSKPTAEKIICASKMPIRSLPHGRSGQTLPYHPTNCTARKAEFFSVSPTCHLRHTLTCLMAGQTPAGQGSSFIGTSTYCWGNAGLAVFKPLLLCEF